MIKYNLDADDYYTQQKKWTVVKDIVLIFIIVSSMLTAFLALTLGG